MTSSLSHNPIDPTEPDEIRAAHAAFVIAACLPFAIAVFVGLITTGAAL